MSAPTNERRADWARRALDYFNQLRGERSNLADLESDIVDLVANLLHAADRQTGMSADECLRLARGHFEAERAEAAQ